MNKKETARAILVALLTVVIASVSYLPSSAVQSDEAQKSYEMTNRANNSGTKNESLTARTVNRREKTLNTIKSKRMGNYRTLQIKINGKSVSAKGFYSRESYYIPFRALANALGFSYTYDSTTRTSYMSKSGASLVATDGCYTIYSSDRPLFSLSPVVIMSDGRMYLPLDSFAKAVGMNASISAETISLTGTPSVMLHASKYYDTDAILWLSRIIHAESSGETLIGKISVGNVVLNRVRSNEYPNTIYGVIFDRKYGVQFSPILNGTIYNTPSYESTLAAKICLEGFDISDGALFFLHPEISTSSWIPSARTYMFSIGKHDFYA